MNWTTNKLIFKFLALLGRQILAVGAAEVLRRLTPDGPSFTTCLFSSLKLWPTNRKRSTWKTRTYPPWQTLTENGSLCLGRKLARSESIKWGQKGKTKIPVLSIRGKPLGSCTSRLFYVLGVQFSFYKRACDFSWEKKSCRPEWSSYQGSLFYFILYLRIYFMY